MKVERIRPTSLRLELHAQELAALITAARWVADGAEGDPPSAAVAQLHQVLCSYDEGLARDRDAGERP